MLGKVDTKLKKVDAKLLSVVRASGEETERRLVLRELG